MKTAKKVLAILFALVLVMSLSVAAFAAEPTTGDITIKNSTTGKDYSIYKVFDATANSAGGIAYTTSVDLARDTNLKNYFEKDAAGNVVAKAAAKDKDGELTEAAIAALGNFVTAKSIQATDTKKGTGSTLKFTGVAFGYYYVTSELGAVVTVTSTTPNAKITDKNIADPGSDPDPEVPSGTFKSIVSGGKKSATTDAGVGKTVDFEVSFEAVNYYTYKDKETDKMVSKAITKYQITDIPTGLTIDFSKAKVTVGEKVLSKNDGDFAISNKTITIPWATVADDEPTFKYATSPVTVTITYSGVVTGSSSDKDTPAATNTVDMKFWCYGDENPTDFPENPNPNNPQTKIYNNILNVENILKDSSPTVYLDGSKYKLKDKDGNFVKFVVDKDGNYIVATPDEITAGTGLVTEINAKGGKAKIFGLDDAQYTLTQTKNTDGYSKSSDKTTAAWTTREQTIIIENVLGTALPETGAKGTTLLLVVGSFVAIAAGLFLVTNKRMSKEAI